MILAESIVVPAVDPIGLPGHPVIFLSLLLLTHFLHILFMNFVLGGSLIAVGLNAAALRGHATAREMAGVIFRTMPVVLSMAITMGVAPLLFVQVLYGPYFYSANVRMGFAWFSLFIVAMIGFYLVYWLIHRGGAMVDRAVGAADSRPGLRLAVSMLAAGCFLWVGWVMANNHELSLRPALWRAGGSFRWYTSAATTIPRYLHDVVGATAVAGLWLAGLGWWRTRRAIAPSADLNAAMIRLGLRLTATVTAMQVAVGIILLFSLEPAVRNSLLGFGSPLAVVWTVSLLGVVALFGILTYASAHPQQFKWYAVSVATTAAVIVGMLMGREHVRQAYLAMPTGGGFTFKQWAVYPQYGSLIVFALLLVAGLGAVGLMSKWFLEGSPAAKGTSERTAASVAGDGKLAG